MGAVKKLVADMYVRCSFPLSHDCIAASDTCQGSADSVVADERGMFWYRCAEHAGWIRPGVRGAIHQGINVIGFPDGR